MNDPSCPRVFISYSHEGPEHDDKVLKLAGQLREWGIDAWIDRYTPHPSEGWSRWMTKQIEEADFILLVCTETYHRRFEGREEHGKGRGGTWEGLLANQVLYDSGTINEKCIPIQFERNEEGIPLSLRAFKYYLLPRDFELLYRHLTDQPEIVAPPIGERRSLPPQNTVRQALPQQPVVSEGARESSVPDRTSSSQVSNTWSPQSVEVSVWMRVHIPLSLFGIVLFVSIIDLAYAYWDDGRFVVISGIAGVTLTGTAAFLWKLAKYLASRSFKIQKATLIFSLVFTGFLAWSLTACHWWTPAPELRLPQVRVVPIYNDADGPEMRRFRSSGLPSAEFRLSDFVEGDKRPIQLEVTIEDESRYAGKRDWRWRVEPKIAAVSMPENEPRIVLAPSPFSGTCVMQVTAVAYGRSFFFPDADTKIFAIALEKNK